MMSEVIVHYQAHCRTLPRAMRDQSVLGLAPVRQSTRAKGAAALSALTEDTWATGSLQGADGLSNQFGSLKLKLVRKPLTSAPARMVQGEGCWPECTRLSASEKALPSW